MSAPTFTPEMVAAALAVYRDDPYERRLEPLLREMIKAALAAPQRI